MANNDNIFAYPMDVTNQNKTEETFNKILEDFGDLDLCVFSSGTYERKSEKGLNVDNVKKVIEVNFLGVVGCVKAVQEYFQNKKGGHISIVSSPVGYRGLPKSSGYTASKASLNNFTQGIYFDFKKFNVRVTLISPGFIKTALTDKNDFKMPFLKDTNYAAEKIYDGLINKKKFEIIFPPQIAFIYKIFQILPNKVYNYLINKFVNR
tara:strand:- start:638 stop:1258 length:621 start_codon:yes stop_codon:yes gene_type:complete